MAYKFERPAGRSGVAQSSMAPSGRAHENARGILRKAGKNRLWSRQPVQLRVASAAVGLMLIGGVGQVAFPAVAVAAALFTSAPVPVVSGTAKVGYVLTAVPGSWGPAPVALSYQWKRGGAAIIGATAGTYKLVNGDAGMAITVTVTGTKPGYTTAERTSAPSATVTGGVLTGPAPTISGLNLVGQKLTASAGTWGPTPVTLRYQWARSGAAINGATAGTYVLTSADLGKTITVTVTGSKTGFAAAARSSTATAVIQNPGAFTSAPVPVVSGTAKVGYVLTAVPGSWGPAPVALSYQWKRGGAAIIGATAGTYKLVNGDAGMAITVTVTGTKPGYTTAERTSAPSATVTGGVLTAPAPTISGVPKVGRPLTVASGTWGPAPVELRYEWKRGSTVIGGANGPVYTPTSADQGAAITVTVIGTKSGFETRSRSSFPTAVVSPASVDRLAESEVLLAGESMKSASGEYHLSLQSDGNLVETFQGRAVWASGTAGSGANRLSMQSDGNLVLYAGGAAVWSSGTAGTSGNVLILQNDGNLVVYGPDRAYWASSTRIDWLGRGQSLSAGQYIRSANGAFQLVVQGDGNAVVYNGATPIWASNTVGATNPTFIVQDDGNVVLYGPSGAVWASNTGGSSGDRLVMQDDGNLVLYGGGRALWASKGGAGAWALADDYPAAWKAAGQDSLVDSWGYYNRECTSWTAWRLHSRNGFEMPRAIGNASNWGTWAAGHGYAVDSSPRPGSVAWSSSGNHVAWVAAVGNGTVTLEEYNYGFTGTYHTRTVATSAYKYIHWKD